MKRKTILIVNWGTQSSDYAFSVAKAKGLEIYLASSINYPAWMHTFVKKENIIITNTYDSEKLLIDVLAFMSLRRMKFDAVTTFFEMNVIQAADLANALGHKFLPPAAARKTSANKLFMRISCDKNNLPSPKYVHFTDPEDGYLKLKKLGVPAVIKPVKSGHSYGVFYIDSLDKKLFLDIFKKAKDQLNGGLDEWMDYYHKDFKEVYRRRCD
jgi:biotin carboxylase